MGKLGIKIDRASSRTLTDQLTDGLRMAIRIGNLKDGETLPTREELVARLGVSKNVVQTAVARLVAEGLVCSRPHSGCRVIRPGSRPMRGHVLEVVTGSELPFWNVRFSESFRRTVIKYAVEDVPRAIGLYLVPANVCEPDVELIGADFDVPINELRTLLPVDGQRRSVRFGLLASFAGRRRGVRGRIFFRQHEISCSDTGIGHANQEILPLQLKSRKMVSDFLLSSFGPCLSRLKPLVEHPLAIDKRLPLMCERNLLKCALQGHATRGTRHRPIGNSRSAFIAN